MKWQPTPLFLPGKSMDRGVLWAIVHGGAKSQTQLKQLHTAEEGKLQNSFNKATITLKPQPHKYDTKRK